MAQSAARKVHYDYSSYQAVNGSLALDLDHQEREYLLRHAGEVVARPTAAPEVQSRPRTRVEQRTAVKTQSRMSLLPLVGFAMVAVLMVGVLCSYIQLTQISHSVVSMEKELAALKEENLALTTQYEMTFDFAAVKGFAEANGMSKISSGQIYYVDLSEGDNAVAYHNETASLGQQVLAGVQGGVSAVVEYFR